MVGDVLVPGAKTAAISDMTPIDFFLLLMFLSKQLIDMVELTNTKLTKLELNKTNCSEMMKFFGVILLMTKFEFTSWASLWSRVAPSKYQPAPRHFGLTGMSKHRFDDLFRAVRWSNQPSVPGDTKSSEKYQWRLVDDFVTNFNNHRANYFSPSDCICVHEFMSRWYGQGGHWISRGLP
jgi:hypothetical protein